MTIVVLLILAGITISLVFSENGIIAKARESAEKTNQATINEQEQMNKVTDYMENMLNGISGSTTPEEPTLPSDGSYSEEKGVNTPKLTAEMTPIKWNGSSWEETTGDDEDWYDYGASKWANVRTSDGSMWVWIPRYAYSITSGYHTNVAGTIEIEFMKGLTSETASGRTSFDNTSGEGKWNIHPAFNYGEEVAGIWVAKFEASSVQGNSDSIEGDNTTSKTLQVKPGVASWRYIDTGNAYTVCLNYDSSTLGNDNLNSHLMKNDEWGAVVYLSRSKYGRNDEVWINNSSSFITGSAGESVSAASDRGTTNDYTSAQGVHASTTDNVYGVYDMSGGSWERVAAYVNNGDNNLTTNGSSLVSGDIETKNVYTAGSEDTRLENYNANASKYGDAIYEISSGTYNIDDDSDTQSWFDDYSYFPYSSVPFFLRGGCYYDTSGAGIFFYHNSFAYGNDSFRPVLVVC